MIEPNTACWYGDMMVRVVACFNKVKCAKCNGSGISSKKEDCDFCEGKGYRVRKCGVCGNDDEAKKKCKNCEGKGYIKSRC
ncbi:MAG: hypothetical protein GF375_03530, partial [Candidatus Omnitrophica bacterium]|nr:hypothetical protein [Candidatus Omnitrophota bacterium]